MTNKKSPTEDEFTVTVTQWLSYLEVLSYIMNHRVDITDVMVYVNKQVDKHSKKLAEFGFDTSDFLQYIRSRSE